MITKIKLGIVKTDIKESQSYNKEKDNLYITGEILYIEKHNWICGWYWGFGYIGNKNLHCHSRVFIDELLWHSVEEVFDKSIFKSDNDFWIFKDLLKQAYILQECAEVYQHGGHCTTNKGMTDIIQSKKKATQINKDLEIILNKLWCFLIDLSKKR